MPIQEIKIKISALNFKYFSLFSSKEEKKGMDPEAQLAEGRVQNNLKASPLSPKPPPPLDAHLLLRYS